MSTVRTRFAPSPTGYLHIGGLRTALFSWLFARHNDGIFVLRIEDTDRSRLIEDALGDIIESLRWAGMDWDEGPDTGGPYGPYLQSERRALYSEYTDLLLEEGHAYRCFCSQERLRSMKEKNPGQGYDRRCRNLTAEEIQRHETCGDPFVVRLKIKEGETTEFTDEIRGIIKTNNELIDDFVLMKSDGFPTYHLANVVDDHLMKISHVIRGDEWISSTPKHVLLYETFGWSKPVFAHVPVILREGGGKLSKRHGATTVREFKKRGYLPDALVNFIALLGWSLDDKTEVFSVGELISSFDLARVNRAACVFSYEKLDWFNGMYIRMKDKEELYDLFLPYLVDAGLVPEDSCLHRDYLLRIIPLVRERVKHLSEVCDQVAFFFDEGYVTPGLEFLVQKKLTAADSARILELCSASLQDIERFEVEEIENALRGLVGTTGYKTGQVFMTIRVAVTGRPVSPGLFETMQVLGKKRVQKRLRTSLSVLKKGEQGDNV
ncbi:MAG: glutamate--tRNA ligase [Spirochaetes bacterium]|nr:glutamate--tRNA ligase [Spirochaetota bacterium]